MSAAVGKKLRQARQALELSLEQAAAETHIRLHYLRAMEDGQFDVLPSKVQMRGFLRLYASYLRIDTAPLFDALERDALLALMPPDEPNDPQSLPPEDNPIPETPKSKAEANLETVGESLKHQRELLGLSLEDVERHTHLRLHYLKALERGDMEALPSTVQGTGMLKNYAAFLGLDPEPMLLRFAENLQFQLRQRQEQNARPARANREPLQGISLFRRIFSRDIFIGGTIIVGLLVFAMWAGAKIAATRAAQEPQPTPPSIADVLLPSATPTIEPSPTATIPSPLEEAATAAAGGENLAENPEPQAIEALEGAAQVQIAVHQRAFMRIIVDGEIQFNGRVKNGEIYAFAGEESVEILTGNAAALYVTYNGETIGALGLYGEVVNVILSGGGLLTPTPTISPTPTRTPRRTAVPSPTPNP